MNHNQLIRLLRPPLYRKGKTRYIAAILIAVALGYPMLQPWLQRQFGVSLPTFNSRQHSGGTVNATSSGAQAILDSFRSRRSNVIVECELEVERLLPDDNKGSRHQKMILRVPGTDHTVLLAHNIDLAPRVPARKGDTLRLCGEYEYSDKGGVVHWTHHDPQGRHEPGWIELEGQRYE